MNEQIHIPRKFHFGKQLRTNKPFTPLPPGPHILTQQKPANPLRRKRVFKFVLWFASGLFVLFHSRWLFLAALPFIFLKHNPFGLGDWFHFLFNPFARFGDHHFGTKLATCRACSKRRAWLNALGRRITGIPRLLWDGILSPFKRLFNGS